jgi:hypothetical protein
LVFLYAYKRLFNALYVGKCACRNACLLALKDSGDYGQLVDLGGKLVSSPSYTVWGLQMVHWIFGCVIPARLLCLSTVFLLRSHLAVVAAYIGSWFVGHPHTELMFVMICGPLVLNSVQFILQDLALKHDRGHEARTLIYDEQGEGLEAQLAYEFSGKNSLRPLHLVDLDPNPMTEIEMINMAARPDSGGKGWHIQGRDGPGGFSALPVDEGSIDHAGGASDRRGSTESLLDS